MGELILCNQTLAALPYYFENVSLNVYSLEEICYYLEKNLYLLDSDFMSEELCVWIEKELKLKTLAECLREVIFKNGTMVEFVSLILDETAYCSRSARTQILQGLNEMQNKSPFECGKIRGDRYMENGKYVNAILEYRRLLQMQGEYKHQTVLCGDMWHNLGVAYARLFLFEESVNCFFEAYKWNQNYHSLEQAMAACHCGKMTGKLEELKHSFGITDEEVERLLDEWSQVSRREKITSFEESIDTLFEQNYGPLAEDTRISGILDNWKATYRKNGSR